MKSVSQIATGALGLILLLLVVISLAPEMPRLRLTASKALGWLHVYAPPDEDFFCVEPVSHAPNGVNMANHSAHGIWTLGPGETAVGWMRLDLV